MAEVVGYTSEQDRKITTAVRTVPGDKGSRRPPGRTRHLSGRPNIRGVLLQDLFSNGTAEVAVLDWVDTNDVKAAKFIGDVTGGTFKLTYNGTTSQSTDETTGDIAYNATAAAVRTALGALSSLSESVLEVDAFAGMWFIQFLDKPFGSVSDMDMTLVDLEGSQRGAAVVDEHWVDSGRTEIVYATIPVGIPTPMRAGAIVAAIWLTGPGYSVVAVEPRDFFNL